jgi:hypothetical protein
MPKKKAGKNSFLPKSLLDICSYLGEISLHVVLVLLVDDVDEFGHLVANLTDLVLGVGVEENFTQ